MGLGAEQLRKPAWLTHISTTSGNLLVIRRLAGFQSSCSQLGVELFLGQLPARLIRQHVEIGTTSDPRSLGPRVVRIFTRAMDRFDNARPAFAPALRAIRGVIAVLR